MSPELRPEQLVTAETQIITTYLEGQGLELATYQDTFHHFITTEGHHVIVVSGWKPDDPESDLVTHIFYQEGAEEFVDGLRRERADDFPERFERARLNTEVVHRLDAANSTPKTI